MAYARNPVKDLSPVVPVRYHASTFCRVSGKKILSCGILYTVEIRFMSGTLGAIFPFSQLISVCLDMPISFAAFSCVSPAFTRAASSVICSMPSLLSSVFGVFVVP